MIDRETRLILVAHNATDREVRSLVTQADKIASDSNNPFYLSIAGYDTDPRNLWEIPEAVELCKRLTRAGMMTPLVPGRPDETKQLPGLTALQLWLIATGRIGSDGRSEITKELYDLFIHELNDSNKLVDGLPPDDGEVFVLKS